MHCISHPMSTPPPALSPAVPGGVPFELPEAGPAPPPRPPATPLWSVGRLLVSGTSPSELVAWHSPLHKAHYVIVKVKTHTVRQQQLLPSLSLPLIPQSPSHSPLTLPHSSPLTVPPTHPSLSLTPPPLTVPPTHPSLSLPLPLAVPSTTPFPPGCGWQVPCGAGAAPLPAPPLLPLWGHGG